MKDDEINLSDYPDIPDGSVEFPESVHIAYAVCTKKCGVREFIVDGSTQRCQTCGKLMFRTDVSEYKLKKD